MCDTSLMWIVCRHLTSQKVEAICILYYIVIVVVSGYYEGVDLISYGETVILLQYNVALRITSHCYTFYLLCIAMKIPITWCLDRYYCNMANSICVIFYNNVDILLHIYDMTRIILLI